MRARSEEDWSLLLTSYFLHHALGGPVAAHAVDTATGWGGGGAKEDFGMRGGVGVDEMNGAGEKLPPVGNPAYYVAADVVGIVEFHLDGVECVGVNDGV